MKDYASYGVEDFITDESYLRYYFKENEADIAFWTEWIKVHPEKLDIIISANNYIDSFSVRISETEFHKEQQRFTQALDQLMQDTRFYEAHSTGETTPEKIEILPEPHTPVRKIYLRTAAAATILIAGMTIGLTLYKHSQLSDNTASVAMIEKYVPKGERAKITLPDGTEVELNADSKISYPAKFTGASRELKLSGEAFFSVKQDTRRPFHVKAGDLDITVLGTTFNMQCYNDKSLTKVALVTGKVQLTPFDNISGNSLKNQSLILTPSEMGVFNNNDHSLQKTRYDLEEVTAWRQGNIIFKEADFEEIADRFDKAYNILLINQSHKKEFRFTGTFISSTPDEIIKSICLSKKLSYTTKGNTITIH